MNKLKPWGVLLNLRTPRRAEHVALELNRRARARRLPLHQIEGVESRSSLSTSFPMESQVALLKHSLAHREELHELAERTGKRTRARSCGDLAPARALHRAPPRSGGAPGRDDQTRRVRPQRSHGISHAARAAARRRVHRAARRTSTARRCSRSEADGYRAEGVLWSSSHLRARQQHAGADRRRAGERGHQQSRRRRGTRHRRRARHRDARGGPSRPWHAGRLRGGARRRDRAFRAAAGARSPASCAC